MEVFAPKPQMHRGQESDGAEMGVSGNFHPDEHRFSGERFDNDYMIVGAVFGYVFVFLGKKKRRSMRYY